MSNTATAKARTATSRIPPSVAIALIPGDGVGPEVVSAALPVLRAAAASDRVLLELTELDWGGERYLREGQAMPSDASERLRAFDGVLFGAVGRPDIPDHVSSWGLILPLRQRLGLFANVRPVRAWPGVRVPVTTADGIDFVVVRENSEGEYSDIGGRVSPSRGGSVAVEVAIHTREAIERIARFGFELARARRGRLTLATKSNSLRSGYTLWDEVVRDVGAEHPDVELELAYVDALAARIVQFPGSLDVVLASNLFGDILSDLAAVLQGGLGMAPSANVTVNGQAPGIYEPVHGSAPDIAGRGIANPIGCVLSGAMMLEDLGLPTAAERLRGAVARTLSGGESLTPDLGGRATTAQVAQRIGDALEADAS